MSGLQAESPRLNPAEGPKAFPVYLLLGLVQGVALWLLTMPEASLRFLEHPALHSALIHFAAGAPLAWYLLAGSPVGPRTQVGIAVTIAVLIGGLAAHAVATSSGGREPFSFMLAAAVLSYMLVALASGFDPQRRWFSYTRLFDHGWRNVLLVGASGALTGILWVLLWGAAFLLAALGIETLSTLLNERVVLAVVTCTAFAFFIRQATISSDALIALRKFWLTLNTWFLPLALLLAIVWVGALAVVGPKPLFETRRAAQLLFWFVALAVVFMNAAHQDGRAVPYGRRLSQVTTWAWLSVPVLAAVGLWALAVRIGQHGWTVDRLWAAVVGGMAVLYGVGYSASTAVRSRWMPTVETTNIVAALALCVVIVLSTSPIADFRKVAVQSQLARLRAGQAGVAALDLAALKREGGQWGRDALEKLAVDETVAPALRSEAAAQLARVGPSQEQNPELAMAALRKDLRVLPSGTAPDPLLLALLARADADWSERMCVRDSSGCAVWMVDLDGDGTAEALLLRETNRFVSATLYAKGPNGWKREADLQGSPMSLADWTAAIDAKSAAPVQARWPDLQVGDRRYSIR